MLGNFGGSLPNSFALTLGTQAGAPLGVGLAALGPPQGRPSLLLSFLQRPATEGLGRLVAGRLASLARPPQTAPAPAPRTVTRWRLAWRQGGSQARHPASQATRLSLERP